MKFPFPPLRPVAAVVVAGCLLGRIDPAAGATFELKVASVAPAGTSFNKNLEDLGAQCAQAPGGGVVFNIFPGTQGGEPTIVRRMRGNALQGAMLTGVGLSQIDESVTALQLMPMAFQSWAEMDFVRTRLEPRLEKIFLEKNYIILFWGDAGWVRVFSTEPVQSLADLKSRRVFASSGMPKALEMLTAYYTPVEMEPDKILLSLRNGMINVVPIPAFLANFSQVATKARYMLDMKWVPVVGAMVVTKAAWDKLPPATQTYVRETSRKAGEKIRADSRREDDEAIQAMVQKQGLKVTSLSPEADKAWRDEMDRISPRIRGNIVPADVYDTVQAALQEFRAQQQPPK
jgi:TRAP-type C4-dicarboxylate transport system substrate-binding protein